MVRNCLPCTRTPQLTDSPFFVRSLSCSVTSPWWRHRTPTMYSSRPAFGTVWMACAAETRPVNTEMLPVGAWWCIYSLVSWVIIGSGNGLWPVRCQGITWTSATLLGIRLLGRNLKEILNKINTSPFRKMYWMSSIKCLQFCKCLNVSIIQILAS